MAFETPTNGVTYTGKNFNSIGVKTFDSLTSVIEKIVDAQEESIKRQNSVNEKSLTKVNDSDIKLESAIRTHPKGKWGGTLSAKVQAGSSFDELMFDTTEFTDNVDDSIISISTEIYGEELNGRTLISSSDKSIFGISIGNNRYPIFGKSTVRVLEDGGDVSYEASFQIGSGNIRSYSFDYEASERSGVAKTQQEFNQSVMDSITQIKDALGINKIELNGTIFDSWKSACTSLQSTCNSLQRKIDDINNSGNITKSVANCGEVIKTEGCVNC